MNWTENNDGTRWDREDGAYVVKKNTASGARPWQRSYWGFGSWRQYGGTWYASAQGAMKAVDRDEPLRQKKGAEE